MFCAKVLRFHPKKIQYNGQTYGDNHSHAENGSGAGRGQRPISNTPDCDARELVSCKKQSIICIICLLRHKDAGIQKPFHVYDGIGPIQGAALVEIRLRATQHA